jgi:hypothetical protein
VDDEYLEGEFPEEQSSINLGQALDKAQSIKGDFDNVKNKISDLKEKHNSKKKKIISYLNNRICKAIR